MNEAFISTYSFYKINPKDHPSVKLLDDGFSVVLNEGHPPIKGYLYIPVETCTTREQPTETSCIWPND